jgi:uncharacterized membrane protein
MSTYTLVLFFHIIGAIGYFLSIGIWLLILVGLRQAQRVDQVRVLIHLNNLSAPFGAGSAVMLLITGLYLALTAWSLLTGWILVALISLLLIVPTTAVLVAPRRNALVKQLAREASEGALSEALKQRTHDPVLLTLVQTVAALLLGIVFLMTTKPDLAGSLIVMAIALLLGLLASLLVSRKQRARQQEMVAQKVPDNTPAD